MPQRIHANVINSFGDLMGGLFTWTVLFVAALYGGTVVGMAMRDRLWDWQSAAMRAPLALPFYAIFEDPKAFLLFPAFFLAWWLPVWRSVAPGMRILALVLTFGVAALATWYLRSSRI